MAVSWRKPDNIEKQKKIKPSVKKKIKATEEAKAAAEAAGVPYVPTRGKKNSKRKRDDEAASADVSNESIEGRPKKQAKRLQGVNGSVQAAEAGPIASNGDVAATPVNDMPLQGLAFVDVQGTGVAGPNVRKDGTGPRKEKNKPAVRKQKLLPKKERKELKKLKKMGLARGKTAASIMAEREPEKKEDTRKVRKERRRLRKKGLFAELAEFEVKVAADKEAKKQKELEEAAAADAADADSEAITETQAESGADTLMESALETNGDIKAERKRKKKSKNTSKAEAETDADNTVNDGTVAGEEADADNEPTHKRKREPLPDPVIPQKEHRFIVFVGNLPFSATKEEVTKHFKAVHPTNVRLMTEKETGKPRGFAFVEFDRYDYMKSCLAKYHHSHFRPDTPESRRINVELTAGGGGTSEERRNKIKDKNQKLRHEQFRRRERAKDEEYSQKQLEKAAAAGAGDKSKGKNADEGAASSNGVHPSRMHRVKQ